MAHLARGRELTQLTLGSVALEVPMTEVTTQRGKAQIPQLRGNILFAMTSGPIKSSSSGHPPSILVINSFCP